MTVFAVGSLVTGHGWRVISDGSWVAGHSEDAECRSLHDPARRAGWNLGSGEFPLDDAQEFCDGHAGAQDFDHLLES